jgi:anti-sigma28 factor (negative regulator of flagellin synthesis)
MVGMYGLDGITPTNGPPRTHRGGSAPGIALSRRRDAVEISPEAASIAALRASEKAAAAQDVANARIEAAKQSIEDGTYKLQHVVLQVAARIAEVLDNRP